MNFWWVMIPTVLVCTYFFLLVLLVRSMYHVANAYKPNPPTFATANMVRWNRLMCFITGHWWTSSINGDDDNSNQECMHCGIKKARSSKK